MQASPPRPADRTDHPGHSDRPGRTGQLIVGLVVVVFGILVLWASQDLEIQSGYAGVGPGALPRVTGTLLLILGAVLVRQAWTTGLPGIDEPAERALGFHWPGFRWVSAGLLANAWLIEPAGFPLASTGLFAAVARGFGSRRWLRDALIGLTLALAVYLMFSVGLKTQLPVGPFTFLRL